LLAAHADEGAEEESKHGGNEHEGQSLHGESNEGHGGKASHGESGEEKPNPVNLAVSFMLLGSVIFNMSIFYLVNHHDPDIKHNSWAVLSSTIAIFVSVLMFSGIQGILDAVLDAFVRPIVPDQVEEQAIIWIRFANMGVWYVVLYHTLRRQAQFLGTIRHESGRIMSTTNAVMDMQQKLTCWATLFGHMAGFAAISGGTAMQEFVWGQTENFPLQVLFLVLTILVTACVAFVFFLVADRVLACWSTVYRHEVSERIEEYGFEAEVEMAALGLSFLIVQVLTTVVLGKLPVHGGGEHHPPPLEPVWHTVALVALALLHGAVRLPGLGQHQGGNLSHGEDAATLVLHPADLCDHEFGLVPHEGVRVGDLEVSPLDHACRWELPQPQLGHASSAHGLGHVLGVLRDDLRAGLPARPAHNGRLGRQYH